MLSVICLVALNVHDAWIQRSQLPKVEVLTVLSHIFDPLVTYFALYEFHMYQIQTLRQDIVLDDSYLHKIHSRSFCSISSFRETIFVLHL